MHAKPGGERTGDNERYPDVAGILEPQRRLEATLLDHVRLAAEPTEHADGDDERHNELHGADAEIAKAGIERQRVALLRLWKEEGDVRHGRGEVAASEATQQSKRQEQPVRGGRVLYGHADSDSRDDE